MLRAIVFDLDNTLVDRDAAFRRMVQREFDDATVVERFVRLDHSGYGDRGALLREWRLAGGRPLGSNEFSTEIATWIQPDKDRLAWLREIASCVAVGILTNGRAKTQWAKFRRAELGDVVPEGCVWVSEEIGLCKPDPQAFRFACEQLGSPPHATLMVGDQFEIDMQGAAAAGLQTVHCPVGVDTAVMRSIRARLRQGVAP